MEQEKQIPLLTARDVELRVKQLFAPTEKRPAAVTLLVYKDARVDQRILDSVYGPMNWERDHFLLGNDLYCKVSVYDAMKDQWIEKSDVGTPSKTESEKGRASDAFKRACFNWGIGRELYDAPNICISLNEKEYYKKDGKLALSNYCNFKVVDLEYNREIGEFTKFTIVDGNGNVRFSIKTKQTPPPKPTDTSAPTDPMDVPQNPPQQASTNTPESQLACSNCGAAIEKRIYDYSLKRYKAPLCWKCQREADKLNK